MYARACVYIGCVWGVCVCMHAYVCVCVRACVRVCVHVHVYVCACMCMYKSCIYTIVQQDYINIKKKQKKL